LEGLAVEGDFGDAGDGLAEALELERREGLAREAFGLVPDTIIGDK